MNLKSLSLSMAN